MSARSYFLALALCSLTLALMVAGFNYFVDPYGITGAKRINGFNQYKADINDRVRLLKKYQPLYGEFNTLIVGNSRVEMGLDPANHCFGRIGLMPYNAGVPGAGLRRQLEYALNVIHAQPVTRVIIGVDFFDFVSKAPEPVDKRRSFSGQHSGEFRFLPSGQDNPDYTETALLDYYQAIFSLDALASSAKTVFMQDDTAPDRNLSGFNPARDMAHVVRVEGPRALFDQKMSELETRYARERHLYYPGEDTSTRLLDLAEFLDMARDMGLQVDLFIGPFHQLYWELLERRGLLPLYEQWLDALQGLALERSRTQPLSLWDFGRVSPHIEETVPPAGALTEPLRWFWEPSHYRRELGDLMLDSILSPNCTDGAGIGENLLQK